MKRIIFATTLGLVHVAYGATWNLNANGNWDVNANWTAPATFPNAVGGVAIFGNIISANRTITGTIPITVGTISFDDNNNYLVSLSGNTLTLNNAGTAAINVTIVNGNGTHTISAPVSLANPTTFTTTSASTFTMSGVISGGNSLTRSGAGTGALTLTAANTYSGGTIITGETLSLSGAGSLLSTGSVNLSGATAIFNPSGIAAAGLTIGDLSGVAGSLVILGTKSLTFGTATASTTFAGTLSGGTGASVVKQGSGTTIISGTNTYGNASNGTTINAGTLSISAVANLGAVANPLNFGGGMLQTTASFTIAKAISLATAGTFNVDPTFTTTLSGVISGAGGTLTKIGTGTLTLTNAANSYTGSTNINAGILSISANGNLGGAAATLSFGGGTLQTTTASFAIPRAVSLATAGTFETVAVTTTLSSAVTGVGGSLTKTGTGTLTLTNAGNTYSGGTTINNGTLSLTGAGILLSTGAVSVNSATSIFDISGIAAAGLTIGDLSGVASSSVVLGTKALTIGTATASTTFAGVISGATGSIVKQGSGTVVFSGTNTYGSGTTISAGTLSVTADANLGAVGGVLTMNNGTLKTNGFGVTIARDISLAPAGIFDTNGATHTFSGAIGGVGGTLTKIGSATLVLTNGTNSYTGLTTINEGTLSYGVTGAIASGNSVTVGDGVTGSTFSIDATMGTPLNVTINALSDMVGNSPSTAILLSSILGSGTLNLGVGTRDININPTGADIFPGRITGGVLSASTDPTTGNRLTKAGTSTLTLTNATSSFISRTFVANGVLEVQNGSALGAAGASSAVYVRNATGPATLQINGSITLPKTIFINGIGSGGNGAIRSTTGTNTLSGNLTIGWTGTGEAAAASAIQVDAGSLTVTNVVAGSSNFTKTGGGTLTFSGAAANTYSGTSTVNGGLFILNKNSPTGGTQAIGGPAVITSGTLQLGSPNQILDTTTVTIGGGTFDMNGNAETIGELLFNAGTLTQSGGTLSLSSGALTALTMGSGTTVPGTIVFQSTGGVVYSGGASIATINGDLDLGTFAHVFNIANGPVGTDMIINGAISGVGATITKSTGVGTLEFSGSSINTYSGLTTVNAGTLLLSKSVSNASIPGDVTLNAGGTLLLGADEQISNSSIATLSGGTWNMAGFSETIGELHFGSGTFTQGGGILSLSSAASTTLTMGSGTTVAGNVVFLSTGGVVYSGGAALATISGSVDLGSFAHTFDIANGPVGTDMLVSGALSGSGASITKSTGVGTLEFGGATINTYTGLTTVDAGTLLLTKTMLNAAIPGNATINTGGTLLLGAAEQISDSSVVTLSGGTFNMAGFNETVGQFIYNTGTFTQGGGILTVTNGLDTGVTMGSAAMISGDLVFANTSGLTMGDGTTVSGTLTFQGAGGIVYNGTTTVATISGAVDLGTFAHTFTIADGAANPDMTVSSVMSGVGASITKTGAGTLQLSGAAANTFSGLTTVTAGTLLLNKTAATNAIGGNALINGGILLLGAANQIPDTSTMTISSGLFSMAGNAETLDNLVMSGGSVTQGGATLTLTPAGATALTMGDSTTISGGTVVISSTSGVIFNGSLGTATVSSNIDLSTFVHSFNIGTSSATPSMDLQGVISNGGVTKIGAGVLEFSGASANTYVGLTTVSAGTLLLQKTGVNAIVGNIVVDGTGILSLGAADQITDSAAATVTLNGGTFTMNGFTETIGSLIFNSGALTQGGATLTLSNATSTALTMSDATSISGPIAFAATGGLTYIGTTNGAAISGSVDLGALAHTFNIADGTDVIDQTISGAITGAGGSITKTGAGLLLLTGPNTYSGGTTVSAGTLQGDATGLQGAIVDNSILIFDQTGAGTYAGAITGTGTLTTQGTGSLNFTGASSLANQVTVSSGTLLINGSLAGGGPMTVASGATLGGTGTITKDITIQGTLSPGNSIGTINLVGAQILATGSMYDVELTPTTNDRTNVTGTMTIQPGVTLRFIPDPGDFSTHITHTLIHTTGGVTGTFSTIITTLPLFDGIVSYTPFDVLLTIGFLPFSDLVISGNAGKVAHCLDSFTPEAGSDLAFIIHSLHFAQDEHELKQALLQMQPSQYTALALMQENTTIDVSSGLFNYIESSQPYCADRQTGLNLWALPFTEHQVESRHNDNQGYQATTPGVLVGFDGYPLNDLLLGVALGYSHSDLKWTNHIGTAKQQTGYTALYSKWARKKAYLESAMIFGYNSYHTNRHIIFDFTGLERQAKGQHKGLQGSFHLQAAGDYALKQTVLSPFGQAGFIYIHEDGFQEHGAQSLNLDVSSKSSNLLLTEVGLKVSHCFNVSRATLTPYIQGSAQYEKRYRGTHEKALFNGCLLNVKGTNPSRAVGAVQAGLTSTLADQLSTLSLYYQGRFGKRLMDNSAYLQASIKF